MFLVALESPAGGMLDDQLNKFRLFLNKSRDWGPPALGGHSDSQHMGIISLGFRVWGLGFRVYCLGFRV